MNETKNNPYSYSRRFVLEKYADRISHSSAGLFVAVSRSAITPASELALTKTAESLGYGSDGVTFVSLMPAAEASSQLAPQDLFELLEGLDPICIIACDVESSSACAACYRVDLPDRSRIKSLGRTICAFDDLEALVSDSARKRNAWAILRTIPRFPS